MHHGDGVQAVFYDDPRVLTISLHETGQMLFPGTGFPAETGGPGAEGSAVNVALPPGTADAGWLRAFHAVVPPLVREFAPDVLVTQHGCDSHIEDPLAHLMLTVDGQRAAYLALHDLAHEVVRRHAGWPPAAAATRWSTWCRGPGRTCSRSSAGAPLDPATDDARRRGARTCSTLLGRTGPFRMTDGRTPAYRDWSQGYDPSVWLDRAIHATREAVFPLNGLDHLVLSPEVGRSVERRVHPTRGDKSKKLDRSPLFPNSHTRLYSHGSTYEGSPAGKPGGACARKCGASWPRTTVPPAPAGDISEVKFLTVAEVATRHARVQDDGLPAGPLR